MSNTINKLHTIGQSLWYDNIQRRLLPRSPGGTDGELAGMIARGEIRGVTSNPSIFHNAIARSDDYDAALLPMAWSGWDREQIFWQLAFEDIRQACDLFLPLYRESDGADGYVSLEVSPNLAHDARATAVQARHLWQTVGRPNLMVKIPATVEGLSAIRQTIAAGVNVNVTLIFSIQRYQEVMEAYLCGLEDRLAILPPGGIQPLSPAASVASFFISRIDTKVDSLLPEGSPLRGKAAIASARLAYEQFQAVFKGDRFERLQAAGARLQRPLWASTSAKNPVYPDTLYVDNLVGPDSVNTLPPQTLAAFLDHGKVKNAIVQGLDEARQVFYGLESAGISMAVVTQELENEGVLAFSDAFNAMLATVEERRQAAAAQLGPLQVAVKRRMAQLAVDAVPDRIWERDPSLWASDEDGREEVARRLGWLTLPETSRPEAAGMQAFARQVRRQGTRRFLLLGMGGSSLAPEVIGQVRAAGLRKRVFAILDSTDPAQVLQAARDFPPSETLYIVSSKSGATTEVTALLDYFWLLAGRDGARFVAITDPGAPLDALARSRGFRHTFTADPQVGGRYSALTHFGLVPAALLGLDVEQALASASWMMSQCRREVPPPCSPGLVLGAILGQAALEGRDKLTLLADAPFQSFGSWLEQLIAESSGKSGRGIIVIDGEPPLRPEQYGKDRIFTYLRSDGGLDARIASLRQAGFPALVIPLASPESLFAEFYRWEFATAVACAMLGVNAFDQPDVQDNKERTKAMIAAYRSTGRLPDGGFIPLDGAAAALGDFLAQAVSGDYVAINAYLPRNPSVTEALMRLRQAILERTGCATTLGFGPRFLHSTGQQHKGGPASGLFLQLTADPVEDVEIPGQGMTFGALQSAQALGDAGALARRGRRLLCIHLPSPQHAEQLAGLVKS
ncbi:MAG: bifunctional transaldolase/phosoglucose isomerase [Chloroflexi bacterium]|nr:bifunctional transaldolase/phosoglucose isomerase [Chloroflexota bacterium]